MAALATTSSLPNAGQEFQPTHLDPSELGTKEYWDAHYATDISAHADDDGAFPDPANLESWFDDVDAPSKILEFLSSKSFPLSPNCQSQNDEAGEASEASRTGVSQASVLDLGTGNGSMLFKLRLQARYYGYMVGVDYSPQSIELARRLGREYSNPENVGLSEEYEMPPVEYGCDKIRFETLDIIRDYVVECKWWPEETGRARGGFDLVLDKGTFDAISLSAETVLTPSNTQVRICTLYPPRVIQMVKPGGFLLITSCNWTEAEVVRWFTTGPGVEGKLAVWGRIEYPVFEFGGEKGQGVASICFRRTVGS